MNREQAVYFKLLLLCGYQEELMSYVDVALEKENPLSTVVLELSTCGSDPKKMLSILNEYIISVKQEEIDYDNAVFHDVRSFIKGQYDSGIMSMQEVTDLMYRIALATDRFEDEPWRTMCFMGDRYEEARTGYCDMEDYRQKFRAFINQGTTFETNPPIRAKKDTSSRPKRLTDTERKFRRFDKWSKVYLYTLTLASFAVMSPLVFGKSDVVMLICGALLIVLTVAMIVSASLIGKKRNQYENALCEEKNAVKRTGIFKDIYDEFRHDGFEYSIQSDKFLFDEYYNNTIEFALIKNGHEFQGLIDENTISIIMDEETNYPDQMEIAISKISSVDQFYETVNAFIAAHT